MIQNIVEKTKQLVGIDEFDKKTDETEWANCVIKPTKAGLLAIKEDALFAISNHFSNFIALVGPPGVGKSTLSSAIYNALRGDRTNYFEASAVAMESFTKGIWSLNERTKVRLGAKDTVNVLDLEGIDDEDVIHYLVVVAMTLSKAILLCANYTVNPRFQFSMFKTVESGVRIFKENNIRVPKPIIYIQVPFGMTTFQIRAGKVDADGLFAEIKRRYKILADFEMRLFSLPSFEGSNRFDRKYMQSVQSLIREFEAIEEPKSAKVEDRVKYARIVASALNKNSPQMIHDLNLKFLLNQISLITGVHESMARLKLRHKAEGVLPLPTKISFHQFCSLVCPSGKYGYADDIKLVAKALAYYDAESNKHQQAIQEIDDEKYCLDPRQNIRDIYEKGVVELEQLLRRKGSQFMEQDTQRFSSFVKAEIERYINKIEFYGSTYLPYQLREAVNQKRHELNTELIKNTQNVVKIPADHLSDEVLTKGWEVATNTLKEDWEKRKRAAIGGRKVTTTGDHKCPNASCGNDHSPGVGHKACGRGALWYWIDTKTKYCVCDGGCGSVSTITSVCCWSCGTTLKAEVVPIN
eukprot:CAMPEP_0197032984 /NCGR_PEP_ID=MMETSP1384-20130603/11512_1 /TAXON_ID=29189 /ORGANISM="Ammonia sp." /LENGTH=579 /DNA_ID=CAMNT_0042462723 /DNA_START=71 /DNA_END=1810 /DNA_ORIENTATION=-